MMTSSSISESLTGLQVDCTTKTSAAADGLMDGDGGLAVGELLDGGVAKGLAQLAADALSQGTVGVACEIP